MCPILSHFVSFCPILMIVHLIFIEAFSKVLSYVPYPTGRIAKLRCSGSPRNRRPCFTFSFSFTFSFTFTYRSYCKKTMYGFSSGQASQLATVADNLPAEMLDYFVDTCVHDTKFIDYGWFDKVNHQFTG